MKTCHCDITEVTKAESQVVLNTLAEHDFQGAFKNGRRAENCAHRRKGIISRAMVASRPKVSFFYQMIAPPGDIMDGCGMKESFNEELEQIFQLSPLTA
jgi:hypothetical protein